MLSASTTRAVSRRLSAVSLLALFALAGIAASSYSEDRTVFGSSVNAISAGAMSRDAMTAADTAVSMEFMVSLKMRNFDELQARVAKGELISPAEMAEKYYPLAADYQVQVEWLTGQGFTIVSTDSCRLGILARGTVAQVQQALQVNFTKVAARGETFTSATTAPSLPAAVAVPVLGINGLQPHVQPHKHSVHQALQPTPATGNAPPFKPSEILKAYNANGLTVNGAGQTIGIVIDTFPSTSDLTAFWTAAGVSQSLNNISFIQVVSGTLPAPSGEESLDVEWTSGIAAGAKVRVYASKTLSFTNLDLCYQRILNDLPTQPGLRQVSLSYGLGETNASVSQMQTDSQYFSSLAAGGVTVFVSSGDGGSSPGASGHDHTGPVQVETPASDPNVIAVGGTSLFLSANTGVVSSESAWFDGGGGVSIQFNRPAWQTGSGVPAGTKRCVPDVATAADPNTGCLVVLGGQSQQYGGTSWSAPMFAGFCALINQARANAALAPVGSLGSKIYPLLGTSNFRDITTGNNGTNGVYNATAGFDLCTGIGAPNVAVLIQTLAPSGGGNGQPNLTLDVSTGVTAPATVAVGGNITVSSSVINNGTAASGSFTVRYSLSTDTNFDAADALLGDALISNGLAVNGKSSASFTGVCPNVTPGNYYLVWYIDALGAVAESNENDNVFFAQTQITVTAGTGTGQPNLTLDPQAPIVSPNTVAIGDVMTIATGVINNDTGTAGQFVVRYRLSTDSTYSPATDTLLGDANVNGLTAGATATALWNGVCPNVTPGTYYLVWSIDPLGQVAESNENDNFFFRATQITVTAVSTLPNLTLDPNTAVAAPATIAAGASMNVSSGVLCTGANAGAFVVRYRLSTDTAYSAATDTLLGDASVNSLASGATAVAAWSGTCPNVPAGKYYLVWSIDALGQVSESNENDNFFYFPTQITVTGGNANNTPPVIVSGPTFAPLAPGVNTPVTFSAAATDANGDTLAYAWNFGDAGTNTGTSPTHTYTAAGTYTVSVTVSDGQGGSVSGSVTVNVSVGGGGGGGGNNSIAVKKSFTLNFARGIVTLDIALLNSDFRALNDGQTVSVQVGGQVVDSAVLFRNRGYGQFGKFTVNSRFGIIEYATRYASLQSLLAPYGATNQTTNGTTIQIPLSIEVGNQVYGGTYSFFYRAVAGRMGKGF